MPVPNAGTDQFGGGKDTSTARANYTDESSFEREYKKPVRKNLAGIAREFATSLQGGPG